MFITSVESQKNLNPLPMGQPVAPVLKPMGLTDFGSGWAKAIQKDMSEFPLTLSADDSLKAAYLAYRYTVRN